MPGKCGNPCEPTNKPSTVTSGEEVVEQTQKPGKPNKPGQQ